MESQGRRLRAQFFSSVAHELRTPLNSIIPILTLVLDIMGASAEERISRLVKIAINSSTHLSNVIEDALDISRLENNKFSIFKETFEIRKAIEEVADIMRF